VTWLDMRKTLEWARVANQRALCALCGGERPAGFIFEYHGKRVVGCPDCQARHHKQLAQRKWARYAL